MLKNNKAFTIVELLVVMVIIAILISLSVVGINGLWRTQRDTTRMSDLRNLQIILTEFRRDYGYYPTTITADTDGKIIINKPAPASNEAYNSMKVQQTGLNTSIDNNPSTFCQNTRSNGNEWYILYSIGTATKPQDYGLAACLESGRSKNIGIKTMDGFEQ